MRKYVTNLVTLMAANSKLTTAIHITGMLSMMGETPLTSEMIARSVGTNPVVVRRIIGQLAAANIVSVKMGTGGGASLARRAETITLADVLKALDEGTVFDVPQFEDAHQCEIGKIVRPVLAEVLGRAENKLFDELNRITLAFVIGKVKTELAARCPQEKNGGKRKKEKN